MSPPLPAGPAPPVSPFDAAPTFVVTVVVWLLLGVLAFVGIRALVRWMTRRALLETEEIAVEILRWPVVLTLAAYGLLDAWRRVGADAGVADVASRAVQSLAILLGAYVTWRLLFEVVVPGLRRRTAETESGADDLLIPILSRIGPVVIIVGAANAIVLSLGGNLGVWVTGVGLLGLVLAYLFQEPVQGLFSGTYLSLDRPFRDGDLLIIGEGTLYRVQSVGVRVTRLYDVNRHTVVYVPNSKLVGEKIVNVSRPSVELRTVLTIGVDQPRDPGTAAALLVEACNAHENILGEWRAKEAAIRARLAAYRARLAAPRPSPRLPGEEEERRWIERRIERVSGGLIRLHVESMLRESGEAFSQQLLGVARWASHNEHGGFDEAARAWIKRRVELLMDDFDVLIEEITTWLYLLKVIEYHLIDESYDEPMRRFVESHVGQDGHLLLEALRECGFPGAPTRPMVRRDDLVSARGSELQAEREVDRGQFKDRAEYLDYERLYVAWHRNITHVYRELLRLSQVERLQGRAEIRFDERVRAIERRFADTFLLKVGHWQLPTAILVDVTANALKFELAFFVDDALRDECHRHERVMTELLIEVDRIRSVYQSSLVPPNGPVAAEV